jgi:TRAP-type mannitol/chloroaromatic compound transport system permease small subunit
MDKILGIFSFIKGWVSSRLKERTSWDGAALIAAGVCFLLFKGVATIVAYAAIAYGAWTLWKKEYKD